MKYPIPAFLLVLSLLTWPLLNPSSALAAPVGIVTPPSITFSPVRSIRIPLSLCVDNREVCVYIKVNGHKALPFLLDTGNESSLSVDGWASEELGIKKTSEFSIVEPGHQKSFYGDLSSTEIETSDPGQPFIPINATSALCEKIRNLAHLKNGERCAGVLGLPFFENGAFTIDVSSRSLIFYPDGNPPISNQKSVTLPLVQTDAALSLYFVRLETNGQPCDYLLDTGSVNSSLTKSLLPEFLKSYQQAASFLTFRADEAQTLLTDSSLVKNFRLQRWVFLLSISMLLRLFQVAQSWAWIY